MSLFHHQFVQPAGRDAFTRRSLVKCVSAGALAGGASNCRDLMSVRADELRKENRAMILLFMQGGPSQFETFDPKPGTEHGGETKAISTAVSGVQIANGWNKTAQALQHAAIIRS